jgi:hypothetical protein
MGPAGAVQAHLDLRARLSIAVHFQVFQLGADEFHDALNELKSVWAGIYNAQSSSNDAGKMLTNKQTFLYLTYLKTMSYQKTNCTAGRCRVL